ASPSSPLTLWPYEIRIDAPLPSADLDLAGWRRRLLARPKHPRSDRASRSAALYTMLHPGKRHFRREVGILYDFTPAVLPWTHIPETRGRFGFFYTEAARRLDKAVAISRSTRADARRPCGLGQADIVVGSPGPSLCVREHACTHPLPRDPQMILLVSTLEPRKNGQFVLDWFLNTRALPAEMELCWVGPRGWLWDAKGPRRSKGPPGRKVRFTGVVSERELCQLYRRATFAIYPSLYEGFGFPVLDALWHGKPVLCGYNSSLQEFGGPGVFYFDACDRSSLDQAYRQLLREGGTTPERG